MRAEAWIPGPRSRDGHKMFCFKLVLACFCFCAYFNFEFIHSFDLDWSRLIDGFRMMKKKKNVQFFLFAMGVHALWAEFEREFNSRLQSQRRTNLSISSKSEFNLSEFVLFFSPKALKIVSDEWSIRNTWNSIKTSYVFHGPKSRETCSSVAWVLGPLLCNTQLS